jgi:hypothetical protein
VTRPGVGLGLIAIAAFLFATRYVSAAIFGSNATSWDAELFHGFYRDIGSGLTTAAIVALIAGTAYLVWGELTEGRSRRGGPQG